LVIDEETSEPESVVKSRPALVYVPGTATKVDLPARDERRVVLSADGITVRFGGLTAVDDVSLQVREGEIVGLIGPNGAGKTTLFNAISGLNEPTAGTVQLSGEDITRLPVHHRAARGMGRTFQAIQLFPELTVFQNLLVATHLRNSSTFVGNLFASGGAVGEEHVARRRVIQVVQLLGLEDVAHRPVGGLPFGVLRLVEAARALVTGAPFVMLDEPASGLDNTETDRFADLLLWMRQSLGITLLLIEHDVRMVTALTDYMYVIDRGKLIAEGTPDHVQRNEAVVAAYLGRAGDSAPPPDPAPAPGKRVVRVAVKGSA
jgi:branched-chain amino acid transport system ATP-binding protein